MTKASTTFTACTHGWSWLGLLISIHHSVGIRVRNILVSRLFKKQQGFTDAMAFAVAACATGILDKATFLQTNNITSRYSAEAVLVNILGVPIVFLGGGIMAKVTF